MENVNNLANDCFNNYIFLEIHMENGGKMLIEPTFLIFWKLFCNDISIGYFVTNQKSAKIHMELFYLLNKFYAHKNASSNLCL